MKITNNQGLPDIILRAIERDPYDPGDSDITATQLIGPARIHYLLKYHSDELKRDASEFVYALGGQAMHAVIERSASTDDIVERRFYSDIQGWKLGGQVDLITGGSSGEQFLIDFKETSVWTWVYSENGYRDEWENQLNVLAWLAEQNGHNIKQLSVIVRYRDWQRSKAGESSYPSSQIMSISIPSWTNQQREDYINNRIDIHKQAESGQIQDCTAKEKWANKDQWAVIKPGRKSALRVFNDREQARQYTLNATGQTSIQHRPGKCVRCESYCPVRDICPQRRKEKQQDDPVRPDDQD